MGSKRNRVTVIAWAQHNQRAREFGDVLHATDRLLLSYREPLPLRRSPVTALRYVVFAGITLVHLMRVRPRIVLVQAPPVPAVLTVALYARLATCRMIIDAHPRSFGEHGDRWSGLLWPAFAQAIRLAEAILVPSHALLERVDALSAAGIVFYEPRLPERNSPNHPARERPRVIVLGTFEPDDPTDVMINLARRNPDLEVLFTGNPHKLSADLVKGIPKNVTLLGFLSPGVYLSHLAGADVAVSLTSGLKGLQRSACEAVALRVALVSSDYDEAKLAFPHSELVPNETEAIEAALRRALATPPEKLERARRYLLSIISEQRRMLYVRAGMPNGD